MTDPAAVIRARLALAQVAGNHRVGVERHELEALLEAFDRRRPVPEGWAVRPMAATREMLAVSTDRLRDPMIPADVALARVWQLMGAAAPGAPL